MTRVEQLRKCYEGLNGGDLGPLGALLAPEFVYHTRPELPGGGTYRGRTICLDRLRELGELVEHLRWEPESFVEAGPRIMVVVQASGRGRRGGVDIQQGIVHVWTIENGQAVELRVFSERRDALQLLGLPGDA